MPRPIRLSPTSAGRLLIASHVIVNSVKSKGFAPIIILVLIALAVVGYFGYKNYWPKLQSLVIPTPTEIPDLTTNWKTYTNSKIGFSLKYPDSLTVNNEYYYDPKFVRDDTVLFGLELKNNMVQTLYTLTVYSTKLPTIKDWIEQSKNIRLPSANDIVQQQQKQIGTLDVQEIKHKYGIIYVFSDSEDRIFELSSNTNSITDAQILSTFKFTK